MSKKGQHMSAPSKMPCFSFDLSVILSGCAARCVYGITNICYVITNFHEMEWNKARQNVLKRNHELLESVRFNSVLQNELLEDGDRWFRFFSAGDFPNIESMHKIMDVCRSIDIDVKKFWIPTSREDILIEYLESGNTIPNNVCIRFSSPSIGDPSMPQLPYITKLFKKHNICYSATSMDRKKVTCPASLKKHGQCGTCRNCWDKTNKLVVYFIHNTTSIKRAKEYLKNLIGFGDGATVP
jgi:hypothetical protein